MSEEKPDDEPKANDADEAPGPITQERHEPERRSVLQQPAPDDRPVAISLAVIAIPLLALLAGLALFLTAQSPTPGPTAPYEDQSDPAPAPDEVDRTTETNAVDDRAPAEPEPQPTTAEPDSGPVMPPLDDFLKPDQRSERPARGTAAPDVTRAKLPSVRPATPWRDIDPDTVLHRIAFGSCLHQRQPQPIWTDVMGLRPLPQLFLMIGDNVYGDVKGPGLDELISAYRQQGAHPEFSSARKAFPFLATWDDHDYGANDAGANFPHRDRAAHLFLDFWQIKTRRAPEEGIYYARNFGRGDERVQIIMLDTRSFRSPLKRKPENFPYWGKYGPDANPRKTMLGDAQWQWLAEQLRMPATVRIIVSSVQVLADDHGFERWGNLPFEQSRLLQLIKSSDAHGVIFLSGDRHLGAIYAKRLSDRQIVPELTSSSLNRSYGPGRDGPSRTRLSNSVGVENFGLIDIDWKSRKLRLRLVGFSGRPLESLTMNFSDLGVD